METLLEYGVWACFLALILTPFGLPIPEEISLLTAGVLIANDHSSWGLGWILGFLGCTLGDVVSWYFGRTVGLEPSGFVSRLIGEKQIEDVEKFYRRWGDWAIVIARQIPGLRFPTFFFAGASAVSLGRFYLIDGLAALVTVNLYIGLGWFFADDIRMVRETVFQFIDYAGWASGAVVLLLISLILIRRFRHNTQ